jgi:hypothetical protein
MKTPTAKVNHSTFETSYKRLHFSIEEIKRKIVAETFAVKAYRTLLIAYSDYTEEEYQRLKA